MAKSTKKSSKGNFLANSIKLNSPAGKLTLFALVFAVIGGGIMLYRSFAYSNPRVHYSDHIKGAGGAVKIADDYASYGSYVSYVSNDPTSMVWNLPLANSSASTDFTIAQHKRDVIFTSCIGIKRPSITGKRARVQINMSKKSQTGGSRIVEVTPSDIYQYFCDNGSVSYAASESGKLGISVRNLTGGDLYVRSISIDPTYVSYTSYVSQ